MKKTYKLTPADDLTVTPPDTLREETIAKMEAACTASAKQKRPVKIRILACAALVCAVCMLMGAGYRLTSAYMTFAAGHGVVKQAQDDIYTLRRAERFDTEQVDAVSMIPVTEGEHAGQWKVTVMTTLQLSTVTDKVQMELHHPDGTAYTLLCTQIGRNSVFTGYIDNAAAGSYTLYWDTFRIPLEMVSLHNSSYAACEYPTADGITVVCFPVAEGSGKMIVRCSLTPKNTAMWYWTEHSSSLTCLPQTIRVTDTEGNSYFAMYSSLLSVNATAAGLVTEAIYPLNQIPDAPIASVHIEEVHLSAQLKDMPAAEIQIPARGETVLTDICLLDTPVLRMDLLSVTNDAQPYTFSQFTFPSLSLTTSYPEIYPRNDVLYAQADIACRIPSAQEETLCRPFTSTYVDPEGKLQQYDADWKTLKPDRRNIFALECTDSALHSYTVPTGEGSTIAVFPTSLSLTLFGDWTIRFTPTADDGIPKEIIRYNK